MSGLEEALPGQTPSPDAGCDAAAEADALPVPSADAGDAGDAAADMPAALDAPAAAGAGEAGEAPSDGGAGQQAAVEQPSGGEADDPPAASAGGDEEAAGGDGGASASPPPAPPSAPAARRATVLLQPVGVTSARLERARAKLASVPDDLEAWEAVLAEARGRPLQEARQLYDQVVSAFPTAAAVWTAWAEAEQRGTPRDDDACRALFARCLLACPHVELWQSYLRFVAATHDGTTAAGCAALKAAHEFALDRLGDDVASGPLWTEYIRFLRAAPAAALHPSAPGGGESARTLDVRKAFTRALAVPTASLDALWRDYEAFETGLSRALAKPLLTEAQPRVAASKAALPERRRAAEAARQALPTLPPPAPPPRAAEAAAAALRAWLAVETAAAERLPEDVALRRVALAWDQALCAFARWPDMWLACSQWHAAAARAEDAAAVLRRAAAALPDCLLLSLTLAEAEEAAGGAPAARRVYEALLERVAPGCAEGADGQPAGAGGASEHEEQSDDAALTWIRYMRAMRRADSAAASRRVFARARAQRGASWRVYAAAAALEHASEADAKVARNIWELGLKNYLAQAHRAGCRADYVLAYADFLVNRLNDPTNARVLFERALAAIAAEAEEAPDADAPGGAVGASSAAAAEDAEAARREAVSLWDALVAFEHEHGTLAAARATEGRRAAALGALGAAPGPRAAALELVSRFSVGDLVPADAKLISHFAAADRAPGAVAQHAAAAQLRAAAAAQQAAQLAPPPPPQPPQLPQPGVAGLAPLAPAMALQMAPPPMMPPQDPLAAYPELSRFLVSLPPPHAIAYLPIPSAEAVIAALMRAEPDAGAAAAERAQAAAQAAHMGPPQHMMGTMPYGQGPMMGMPPQPMGGMMPPQGMPMGGPPGMGGKRRAEDAGFGYGPPQGYDAEPDVFRARARARGM